MNTLEAIFPRAGDRSVFVGYVMLKSINDSLEDAYRLVTMLEALSCKVNLIAFNAHEGTRFQPSAREAMLAFRSGQSLLAMILFPCKSLGLV